MSYEDRDMVVHRPQEETSSPVAWEPVRPAAGPLHDPNKLRQCFPVTSEVVEKWRMFGRDDAFRGTKSVEVVGIASGLLFDFTTEKPAFAYLEGYDRTRRELAVD